MLICRLAAWFKKVKVITKHFSMLKVKKKKKKIKVTQNYDKI